MLQRMLKENPEIREEYWKYDEPLCGGELAVGGNARRRISSSTPQGLSTPSTSLRISSVIERLTGGVEGVYDLCDLRKWSMVFIALEGGLKRRLFVGMMRQ
jgi:hypothetical protein